MTVPQIGGNVRGGHVAQAHAGGSRLPPAERHGQPAAALGGVRRAHRADRLPVGDPWRYELGMVDGTWSSRSSDRRVCSTPRSSSSRPKGQIDDLMHEIRAREERRRAGAGHDADQEDGRGPDRLPARAGRSGAVPALRGRHPATRRAAARAAVWASTTSSSGSTCSARGSTCPRCRSWRFSTPTRRAFCAASAA